MSEIRERLATLVVGTMCHCDEPEHCHDHWNLWVKPTKFDEETGHMSTGCLLNEEEMRFIVRVVQREIGS